MKTIDPNQIKLAIIPKGTPTFAAIIQKLEADPGLADLRKRDLISGLRRVSKALGRTPEETIADPKWLQPRLTQVAPAALGLTRKSWQNAVSDARAALTHAGIVRARSRRIEHLDDVWADLWRKVREVGDHNLTASLGRFIHFLNNLAVAPDQVTQAHADAPLEAIKSEEIAKQPDVSWRNAVNAWNAAAARVETWPKVRLVLPGRQNIITLPDAALPPDFLSDLEVVLSRMSRRSPFSAGAHFPELAASTIKQRKSMLKRFASELLRAGVPATAVRSVADICDPTLAQKGLEAMLARNDDELSVVIDNMATILISCARRLGLGEGVIAGLIKVAQEVALPSQTGMTQKNRDRLRPLRDAVTLRRLLELPDRLFLMGHNLPPKRAALAKEDALAIAILQVCPLRIGNIAGIRIDQHLQRFGKGRTFLVIPENEVKNGRPMEFELPQEVCKMLEQHLANRSPLLCPAGTPWLFPRRDGTGSIDPSSLSTRLKKRIHEEIGIAMNAHLFRHLAALLYLEANPSSYEAVRRILGHSSVSRTINLYTGLEMNSVMEEFRKVIDKKRKDR